MPKKSVKKKPAVEAVNFEESLAQLQSTVHQLEDGSLGLDESMQQFERGVSLLRQCYSVLEKAEQKIEILTRLDDDGRPVTEDFDATATVDDAGQTAGRRSSRKKKPVENSDDETAADDDDEGSGPSLF